jgi:uncharacterized protein (TIGR03000 family)
MARVVVRVPEDARVELDGVLVEGDGRVRRFNTPLLIPGRVYTFEVRVVWVEDGREVVRVRKISLAAGERGEVDFLAPDAETSK